MKVSFSPNNHELSGTVSFASWSNQDLQDAIRKACHESPRERIVEIVIERDGIKAKFESQNTSQR